MYTLWTPPTPVVDESFKNYIQDFDSKMLLHGFKRMDIAGDFDYSTATMPVIPSPQVDNKGDITSYNPMYYELDPNYFDPVVYNNLLKIFIRVRFFIRDITGYTSPITHPKRPFMHITLSDNININGDATKSKYNISVTNENIQWTYSHEPVNYNYDSLMYTDVDTSDENNPVFIFGFVLSPGYKYDTSTQTSLGLLCLEVYKDKHVYALPQYNAYTNNYSSSAKSSSRSYILIGSFAINGGVSPSSPYYDRSVFYKNTDNNVYPVYYHLNDGYVGTFKHLYCCRYGLYGPMSVIDADENVVISFGDAIENHANSTQNRCLLIKVRGMI